MNAQPQSQHRIRPAQKRLLASALLLTLPIGAMLLKKAPSTAASPEFEQAYQVVSQLAQSPSSQTILFSYAGIGQLDYDRWRQLNGKPIADIDQIQPAEVKAIYQERWQKGNCGQYRPPLDATCLDSMLSFGDIQGKALLSDLPADPAQAAIEVVERREVERRKQLRPPLTPSKRLALREGTRRDQMLTELIAASADSGQTAQLPPAFPAPAQLRNRSPAEQAYAALKPSTVEIEDRTRRGTASTASGVILTAEGLVVTNYHVIQSDSRPRVQLSDGRMFVGNVISVDQSLDLALVQLQGARGLPVAPLASSTAQLQVGDQVFALGSPLGKSWTLTQAQIIELNSTCANGNSPLRCIRTPEGFLQPGNSGGPLINAAGQVIGINRAVQQSTGEGVSIPIEILKQFLAQPLGQNNSAPNFAPAPQRRFPPFPPFSNPFRSWI